MTTTTHTADPATVLTADTIETAALALGADTSWIRLATLRQLLTGIPRTTQDAALHQLTISGKIALIPQANQKVLNGADRAAALWLGNEHNHLVQLR